MMKQTLLMVVGLFVGLFVSLFVAAGAALAAVDVNTADQAALDSIAGVGPSTSKAIIDERNKHGNYKDWNDLEHRVKGIGERNAVKLSAAGLVVNGQARAAGAATAAGKPRADKGDKMDKAEKADKADKVERIEKAGKMEKSDKSDKGSKAPDVMKASDNLK